MGRGSVITRTFTPPPSGRPGPPDARDRELRDPWTPSSGRDLLAGVAVISVLVAILVVYTHDVPRAPRASAAEPLPWARVSAPKAPADWSAVPVTQTLSDLPPALGKAVGAKTARDRARIDRCLAESDESARAAAAGAQVVLRLAPRSSALHVEGVEASGPDTPAAIVECARRALDGDPIPASAVVPGRRYRVRVTLR